MITPTSGEVFVSLAPLKKRSDVWKNPHVYARIGY
jgi:hypothetical protein